MQKLKNKYINTSGIFFLINKIISYYSHYMGNSTNYNINFLNTSVDALLKTVGKIAFF